MSIWLRYLAIVALVGSGLTAALNLNALGQMILRGSFEGWMGVPALNLAFSFATIALAVLIAAPARRGVSLITKVIAVPSVLSGGFGVLSAAMGLYSRMGQSQISLPTETNTVAIDLFIMERAVQNIFFSACTLVLAVLVLVSRRRVA